MTVETERIVTALGAMSNAGPRNLRAYLAQPGPDFEKADPSHVQRLIDLMLSPDPNGEQRLRFSNLLRGWDNAKAPSWGADTDRNSPARRARIHELLHSDGQLITQIDAVLPFYRLEEPLIIAAEHHDWYIPSPGVRDYYWKTYVQYLQQKRGWSETSVLNMDNSTRAIVECLADPTAEKAYASRGLVMGYVQSGKTANFMGVVARAADAGYRLVIVLAGTWNILRNQTQRRFDKELLGKELLANDETYTLSPPLDWDDFLEHGGEPSTLADYTWQRLTRPDIDFRRLKSAIDNLEFERRDKAVAIYDAANLYGLPAKLLVVKKHSGILANLVKDLKLLRTRLKDLPTLIIDDESDQAGLDTSQGRRTSDGDKDRPKTNARIVELLGLFPRGQYVGYTATPYANALVDPDDPEDLFPKDFIISLDRAAGYMGVSDFFDPDTSYDDLDPDDFSQPEIAYIRRVENPVGADDEDLKRALRSYVLAGAIKLFRASVDPVRYQKAHFKHHTMLVHTSQLRGEQTSLVSRLKEMWDDCAFNTARGLTHLEALWDEDFKKVCSALDLELVPKSISDLIPFLADAIKRIESGKVFLLLNSDSPDAPDFGATPVWKIIVGGNKLSRGYTIEGLTVSYYRRVSGTADTLMQMGRWFGFRPGYQDLVRVFLGVHEGRRGDTDLVALFKDVCRMEERFREELKRYVKRAGAKRITPREVPPLISVTGNLPPTSKNKMFNAVLISKNFGGQKSMLTLAPTNPDSLQENINAVSVLLDASTPLGPKMLGGVSGKGKSIASLAEVYESSTADLIQFLKGYRWLESDYPYPERPKDTTLQIEFLGKRDHGIAQWLIVAPQRKESFGAPLKVSQGSLTVKERHRVEGRGFQVFGEPDHRKVAAFLSGVRLDGDELIRPNSATSQLGQERHPGVCLLYPVRENQKDKVSVGFELFFPPNDLPYDLNFTAKSKADKDRIVVDDKDN